MPESYPEQASKDDGWSLIAEYSLSNLFLDPEQDDRIIIEQLLQMFRRLGIPDQFVENIEFTLNSFARKVLADLKPGCKKLPGQLRIFCQVNRMDEAVHGGWGYFVIESAWDTPALEHLNRKLPEPLPLIEFYFYEETG